MAVVLIGASAGGLGPLRALLAELPVGIRAALVVAQHCETNLLPELLRSWIPIPAGWATDGARLKAGRIYVCPAQHHVAVNPDGALSVSARERVGHVRPSVDWLFESAAASFREHAIAVVLSGANDDGSAGAMAVAGCGGVVLVQRPDTCRFPTMPRASIATGVVQEVLAPAALGRAVRRRLGQLDFTAFAANWEQPFDHSLSG